MSGAIGFLVALPLLATGAAVVAALAVGALAVGALGYGVAMGIKKLLEESETKPANNDLSQRLETARHQTELESRMRLASIESRQQQHQSMVSGLQSELGKLEKETQQRLQRQHSEFVGLMEEQRKETRDRLELQHNEFLGQLNEHWKETVQQLGQQKAEFNEGLQRQRREYHALFEAQDRRFASSVEEERRSRQRAVEQLQSQIGSILADASRKKDAARSFVNDLIRIMGVTDSLPHRRFAPGEMDKIRRHVEDARRSVESGMPEAALSTAQKAYWDLVDLRFLVVQKEREFMLLHQAAVQEARSLLEEARLSRDYQMQVGEGEEKEIHQLDVDHWTRGELSAHEEKVEALLKRLAQGADSLSIDDVKNFLEDIGALKPKLGEIVEHARLNIVASQLRTNLGELAVIAMREHGFELVDSAYEGDDERNAFSVKVRNIAGGEVVTVIAPIEGEFGKNSVMVNSYDETFVDESTLHQRAQEIVAILKGEGLLTEEPRCIGNAMPEYQDINAIRQRKPTAIQSKREVS